MDQLFFVVVVVVVVTFDCLEYQLGCQDNSADLQ